MKKISLDQNKSYVLDIFIWIYSTLPFFYVFIFWLPFMNENLDMVVMIYQSLFLMWFGILTMLLPQLNNVGSRVMIMYMTVLQMYSATSLLLNFRPKFIGDDLNFWKWATILTIYTTSFLVAVLLEPITRRFLTKFKNKW